MRLFAQFLLLQLALLSTSALATTTVEFDGVWWTSLTETQKLAAVQGLIGGYPSGWMSGSFSGEKAFLDAIKSDSSFTLAQKQRLAYLVHKTSGYARMPTYSKTFGTYVHGIDDFYANHPDRMSIRPEYMVDCLADAPKRSCDAVGGSS